jgi:hypothetical protein
VASGKRSAAIVGFLTVSLVAGVVLTTGVPFRGEARAAQHEAPVALRTGVCVVSESVDGYPDRYLARSLPYKVHPPLPRSGWRPRGLAFDVLFHSLFHGYLVIEYRPGLQEDARALLRAWTRAHERARVVAVPTNDRDAPPVDLAEWNWEARCDRVPAAGELNRFAARRGA